MRSRWPRRHNALQADSRLAHVAGHETGHRLAAVLLHDVATRGRAVVAERRAMRIALKTDVEDAVQRNAMPCQAVIARDAGSTLLLRERGGPKR
jgi:hypothetical protein